MASNTKQHRSERKCLLTMITRKRQLKLLSFFAFCVYLFINLKLNFQVNSHADGEPNVYQRQSSLSHPVDEKGKTSSHHLNDTELLALYSQHPIVPLDEQHLEKPVRVRVLLFQHVSRNISFRAGDNWAISDELLNICEDGFSRSPYFELIGTTLVPDFTVHPDFTLPDDHNVVWVVDMRRMLLSNGHSIPRQLWYLFNATRAVTFPSFKVRVALMDWRDRFQSRTLCTKALRELVGELGPGYVRSVLRRTVVGRHWSEKHQFPTGSHVWDSSRDASCFGRSTLRVKYTVRSDYAEAVLETYPQFLPESSHMKHPSYTSRSIDVAHFWNERRNTENFARLRDEVTRLLQSMSPQRSVLAKFVSIAAKTGRTGVSESYVEAILTSKIVVVAQRDGWEDHYRLFEAIVGGGLVVTDPMLDLPDGLTDKENIVVFQSLDHLREIINYYLDPEHTHERLAIAKRGWDLAMSKHRSYHLMERIFFGRQLSP